VFSGLSVKYKHEDVISSIGVQAGQKFNSRNIQIHLQLLADRRWGSGVLIDGDIFLLYCSHLVTYSHGFYQPMKPQSYEDSYGQMGSWRVAHMSIESRKVVLELIEGGGVV
jgi:hypothetical protein